MPLEMSIAVIDLSWQAWSTLGVIALVMGALVTNRIGVDVAMVGGLTLLMLLGVLDPVEAIRGFAHPAVIIIAGMFVIAAGLEETGGLRMISSALLGRPKSLPGAQARLMFPVAAMSACMNTTPIVAAYMPIVADWAKRLSLSPSKLYLPLSYAAIVGGACTLIGTSSNITVTELFLDVLRDPQGDRAAWLAAHGVTWNDQAARQFWWMTPVAVPAALVAICVVIVATRWMLPARVPAHEAVSDERQYTVEMMVQANSPIVGRTIEQAGLRQLPGLYLTEIERGEQRLPAVAPDTRIEAGDRMIFVGVVDSVVDLRKIRGLVPATDQIHKVEGPPRVRETVEAVVAHQSPLVGRTVRESQFRTRYNAAIIAVARHGHRIKKKIGDIRLQPGDTLLLVTHPGFVQAHRNSGDFYLISELEGAREIRHERAWLSLGILAALIAMIVIRPFGLHPIGSVFVCAMAMVGTRCVTGTIARKSIRFDVLVVIGAAIGIGEAMKQTGAAEELADSVLRGLGGSGPYVLLFSVYMLTAIFAQFITNNGAAVLMFPIVMLTAEHMNLNPQPFVLGILVAAGCNLMTPVAYQTNMMVYGPGGYRFADFLRLGVPITILLAAIVTLLAPLFYPFGA